VPQAEGGVCPEHDVLNALQTIGIKDRLSCAEVNGVPLTTTHGVHWCGGTKLFVATAVWCMRGFPSVVVPTAGLEPEQVLITFQSNPLVLAQLEAVVASPALPDFSIQRKYGHQVGYFPDLSVVL